MLETLLHYHFFCFFVFFDKSCEKPSPFFFPLTLYTQAIAYPIGSGSCFLIKEVVVSLHCLTLTLLSASGKKANLSLFSGSIHCPLFDLLCKKCYTYMLVFGGLAQLVRASRWHREGRGFESPILHIERLLQWFH